MINRQTGGNPFVREEFDLSKNKNILIICEGGTELQYFRILNDKGLYNDLVGVRPVDKIGPDRDDANRPSMIRIANDCLHYNRTGEFPYRYFISFVLSFVYEEYKKRCGKYFNLEKKQFVERLRSYRDDGFNILSQYIDKNGMVIDKDKKNYANKIVQDCMNIQESEIEDYAPNKDQIDGFECLHDPDAVCYLVFDRDYTDIKKYHRDHPDYEEWLEEFRDTEVMPVVTSPCFELWLYMHYADAEFGEPSYLPEYATILKEKLYKKAYPDMSIDEIRMHISEKDDKILSEDRVNELINIEKIDNAIRASDGHLSIFTNNLQKLKDHPGTMVGDFLKPLLKKTINP